MPYNNRPYTIFTILTILHTIPNINTNAQDTLFPTILIFGDSAVDTGNNNYITPKISPNRANHIPYGKDFLTHKPTGRFSNGKLVPDFLAETLGLKESVPAYLDPGLSDQELLTGVSFGSGGSGFDELTSLTTGAMSMAKQVECLRKYVERVEKIVGGKKAKEIVKKSLVVVNGGTDDFVVNYYDLFSRRLQFNVTGYQVFVLQKVKSFIEELYEIGCRTMIISGLPPIGCIPLQMSARFKNPTQRTCIDQQNSDAKSYNQMLQQLLPSLQASLPGSRILYADIYTPFFDLINNPQDYGIKVTNRGCCGTGYIEAGSLCNIFTPTCKNATEFVFWDSVHPTEAAYQYLHDSLLEQLGPQLINGAIFFTS